MPLASSASEYCTVAQVNAPGVSDADKLVAIQDASGEADSYIKKRHALPLLQWGTDLRSAVRRMARYYAFSDRGFDPANAADQAIVNGYRDAVGWLKQIGSGDAELVDVIDSSAATAEAAPLHDGEAPHRWLWGSRRTSEDD